MDVEPAFASASFLAAAIRSRQLGCLEVLNYFIDRVERLDGPVNAVVVRDFERARARARALDSALPQGPLHGVPMTTKESFNIAGLPSTWGAPAYHGHVATTNALAVDRLQAAGAVIFGKTNVPLMLAEWESFNDVYGRTNNPWNHELSAGGSSGGSAAALAAGLTALEIGSDIAGSIRQPAHACGVFGHKPTHGLLPPYGHTLSENAAGTDISVVGPLARSAADLQLAMGVLAGPDEAESALAITLPPPRTAGLQGLRIAVWAEQPGQITDPVITQALLSLADRLQAEGATVDRAARPAFDPVTAYHLFLKLVTTALSGRGGEEERQRTRERLGKFAADDQSANAVMARMVDLPHHAWLELNEQRARLRRVWGAFFRDWDVLLCPVIGAPTWPHGTGPIWTRTLQVAGQTVNYNDLLFWPGITCGYHLPASVAPLGLAPGNAPFGVQIAGPLYGDATTMAVAAMLERCWRPFVPPGAGK